MCTCQIVQPASEVSGELLIGAASIYFIPNVDAEESMELEGTSIVMKFDEIKEYHNRRYQLQERAIEMFLLNGRTYLIAFQSSIVSFIHYLMFILNIDGQIQNNVSPL